MQIDRKLSFVVSSITPFDREGQIDEALFRRQLRRFREARLAVHVGGSNAGEAYSYTPEERDRVLAIAVEELAGKVQVRAMGCEPRLAVEMIDFLRAAERASVDAAQIFSLDIGHGLKPTINELQHYYYSTIESTSLPVYLSSHQAAGYFLPLDFIECLVDRYPTVKGIGYGGNDVAYLAELIERVGGHIEIHCAGPGLAVTGLCLGANGFMGGEANFAPALVASVLTTFAAGDMNGLRDSYAKLMALHTLIHRFGGITMRGVKPLMNAFGMPGGMLRAPRLPISESELAEAAQAIVRLQIPGVSLLPLEKR